MKNDMIRNDRKRPTGRITFALAALALLAVALLPANGESIYTTRFESPTFTAGQPLVGQDGWVVGNGPCGPFNPDAAVISTDKPRQGKQSVRVAGADLIGSCTDLAPYDAVGSYRKPLNVSVAGSVARVEANLRLETNQSVTPDEFFSLTISARSGDGETLGEIGLSSAGVVEAFDFDVAPGSAPAFTDPIQFNQWYHITILIDFANRTTSYFIDDHFLGTIDTPSASDVLLRASMIVYARPDGDSQRADYTAHFDNFKVKVVAGSNDDDGD
jgi:hypothetical protein